MKRLVLLVIILLISAGSFSSCSMTPVWPPRRWSQEDYGSFSPDITYSHDSRYYAVQSLHNPESAQSSFIMVTVYESSSNTVVDSFLAERAFDFWGICWEKDTYNIWIQSADVGTYCMQYKDSKWIRLNSHESQLPEGIINRFRMRNGSFQYVSVYSNDNRYIADRDSVNNCLTIREVSSNEIVYRYSLEQLDDFRGICWDDDGNLWIRSGSNAQGLRFDGETWVYERTLVRPEEVVFSYKWDGTVK